MKSRSIVVLTALLAMFSVAGAASKNRNTIQVTEPTVVGSVVLEPGAYTVEWNGTGAATQVTFFHGKDTVATVPATLETAKNPYDSVTTQVQPSGPRSLIEIDTRSLTLHFGAASTASGQ
ncbi:MAG TPA: hypothetical protein VMT53_10690 [Terriglobales bacterium]|nr:hypothetical protein [Terriglobales bacterium]